MTNEQFKAVIMPKFSIICIIPRDYTAQKKRQFKAVIMPNFSIIRIISRDYTAQKKKKNIKANKEREASLKHFYL